ncbi:EI24 domain-containing protein [Rhodoferax antarcticus]|uniref:Transmembrane domain protein n=1 Tax=Rhodoferax antarcticus ANT.BR TaxID=1111071 RepID=A0A1Q8YDI5_9BURK|nr:EI24 domain-containing protein [Rhodoferax antarcticus]OLP06063.1 transmembrane domain protein [Rhodoferax antarcticus ANT.BR]
MTLLLDSFWRAMLDCLRPRVMLLSLAPLLLTAVLSYLLGSLYWDASLAWVRASLEASSIVSLVSGWMQTMGLSGVTAFLAPLIVIFAVMPAVVVLSLLSVALLMTPALTSMVAAKRFPALQRREGGSLALGLIWALFSTLLALLALVISIPLWFIPPLILVLPPLIWGWLTYRVMAFDALASHASHEERRELFRRHRLRLLGIGVFCGYLGAAPSVIWASGVLFAAAFVVLVPLGIWLYTWVFALSSAWFAHYCLAALQALRDERQELKPPVIHALPSDHDARLHPPFDL